MNYETTLKVRRYVAHNKEYTRRDGGFLRVSESWTLKIDPRGRFTALRCAAIITIDKALKYLPSKKPWVEIAEFLSCYPT
jgi:hypothetical protein